jgi:hypothetical protein
MLPAVLLAGARNGGVPKTGRAGIEQGVNYGVVELLRTLAYAAKMLDEYCESLGRRSPASAGQARKGLMSERPFLRPRQNAP